MTTTTERQEELVTEFVELKPVDVLTKKHTAQVIKYLKATGKPLGLLVNFHEYLLKNGLKRIIYS